MLAILVFVVTLLTPLVSAAPIPVHVSPSTVSLVVFAGIIFVVMCLISLKRVFVHLRRVNTQQNSAISLPLSESAAGSDDSSSTIKEKSAYFVGFWGSPTVEVQCALEKKDWKQPHHSFAYQIHTDSNHRPRPEHPSVLDIARRFKTSPKRQPPKTLVEFTLPSFPENSHSPITPQRRRFSLPVMTRNPTHDSQRRRHSSLKSPRSVSFVSSLEDSPRYTESSSSLTRLGRSLSRPPFTTHASSPTVRNMPISHPFALHPKKSVLTSPPLHALPKLSPTVHRNEQISPNLSAFPPPPTIIPSSRPKLRARTRRSPNIGPPGPSPLRSMILPDEPSDKQIIPDARNGLPTVNLGLAMSIHSMYTPAESRQNPTSSPDPLLGILRELIDETKEWDSSSVFMSQSFKNLLQQSTLPADGEVNLSTSESDHSIQSAEMDPALLGIDFFASDRVLEALEECLEDSEDDVDVGLAW